MSGASGGVRSYSIKVKRKKIEKRRPQVIEMEHEEYSLRVELGYIFLSGLGKILLC